MPILFSIQAISASFPDISRNFEKSFFKIIYCNLSAFFTFQASSIAGWDELASTRE